jgi:hypothetical protein
MNRFTSLLVLFAILGYSCKKDEPECHDPKNPNCDNYDPCLSKSPANADFTISEVHQIVTAKPEEVDTLIEVDTAYRFHFVEFTPVQESYDSLKWIVGAETLRTHTVRRKSFPPNQNVSIKLFVYKKPNKECFPNASHVDSVVKTFYSASEQVFHEKKYRGIRQSNPNNTVTLYMTRTKMLVGIHPYCEFEPNAVGSFGYKYFFLTSARVSTGDDNCHGLQAYGYAEGDSVFVDFSYIPPDSGKYIHDYFRGRVVKEQITIIPY